MVACISDALAVNSVTPTYVLHDSLLGIDRAPIVQRVLGEVDVRNGGSMLDLGERILHLRMTVHLCWQCGVKAVKAASADP